MCVVKLSMQLDISSTVGIDVGGLIRSLQTCNKQEYMSPCTWAGTARHVYCTLENS